LLVMVVTEVPRRWQQLTCRLARQYIGVLVLLVCVFDPVSSLAFSGLRDNVNQIYRVPRHLQNEVLTKLLEKLDSYDALKVAEELVRKRDTPAVIRSIRYASERLLSRSIDFDAHILLLGLQTLQGLKGPRLNSNGIYICDQISQFSSVCPASVGLALKTAFHLLSSGLLVVEDDAKKQPQQDIHSKMAISNSDVLCQENTKEEQGRKCGAAEALGFALFGILHTRMGKARTMLELLLLKEQPAGKTRLQDVDAAIDEMMDSWPNFVAVCLSMPPSALESLPGQLMVIGTAAKECLLGLHIYGVLTGNDNVANNPRKLLVAGLLGTPSEPCSLLTEDAGDVEFSALDILNCPENTANLTASLNQLRHSPALFIGEGDLSFSAAVKQKGFPSSFGSKSSADSPLHAIDMVTSTYEQRDSLLKTYSQALAHMDTLNTCIDTLVNKNHSTSVQKKSTVCKVLHGIDVVSQDNGVFLLLMEYGPFHSITFNFPFADANKEVGREEWKGTHWVAIGRHQELLRGYFQLAKNGLLVRPHCPGPISKGGRGGKLILRLLLRQAAGWDVCTLARESNFCLVEARMFDATAWSKLGYVPLRSNIDAKFPKNSMSICDNDEHGRGARDSSAEKKAADAGDELWELTFGFCHH